MNNIILIELYKENGNTYYLVEDASTIPYQIKRGWNITGFEEIIRKAKYTKYILDIYGASYRPKNAYQEVGKDIFIKFLFRTVKYSISSILMVGKKEIALYMLPGVYKDIYKEVIG